MLSTSRRWKLQRVLVVVVGEIFVQVGRVGLELDFLAAREEFHQSQVARSAFRQALAVEEYLLHQVAARAGAGEPPITRSASPLIPNHTSQNGTRDTGLPVRALIMFVFCTAISALPD